MPDALRLLELTVPRRRVLTSMLGMTGVIMTSGLTTAKVLAVGAQGAAGAQGAGSAAPTIEPLLPGARLLGEGTLRVWGLQVYDASLWVREGFEPARWHHHALALSLKYARELRGDAIAQRSLEEMQRMRPIDEPVARRWLEAMRRCFPDVQPGDRVTGLWLPELDGGGAPGARSKTVFVGPKGRATIDDDADFGQRFFALWMSPDGPKPALRASLLGAASRGGTS